MHLLCAGALWYSYESVSTSDESGARKLIEILVGLTGLCLILLGVSKGFGLGFWLAIGTYLIASAAAARMRHFPHITLYTQAGALVVGAVNGIVDQSVHSLYMAGILVICSLVNGEGDMAQERDSVNTYRLSLPIVGASLLILLAKIAAPGMNENAYLLTTPNLLTGQIACLAIAFYRANRARTVEQADYFEQMSTALCAVVAFTCLTVLPHYWWTAGLVLALVLTAAYHDRIKAEGKACYHQVFGLTMCIFAVGEWQAIANLTTGNLSDAKSVYSPLIWMILPAVVLWAVHKRFTHHMSYAEYAYRGQISLLDPLDPKMCCC